MSSSADGNLPPVKKSPKVDREEFSCRICLELLYKPCVNSCGHTFCFWCFHRAMDFLRTKHNCPLCRAEFRHFPAVCAPLYRYIAGAFPDEVSVRTEQTKKLEQEEYNAESPSIDEAGGASDAGFHLREEFKCVDCGNLACPPTVLSCGHVVCYSQSRKKCPIGGCIGRATDGAPAVCYLMDKVLRESISPNEYANAALESKQCAGSKVETHAEGEEDDPFEAKDSSTETIAPGTVVILSGLRSAAGARLNGSKATVQSYSSSSGRYTILLSSPPPDMRPVFNIKIENVQKVSGTASKENFVHYGVGCDGCGVYPISGRRYKCDDCSEEIGFDLCGDCHDAGVHRKTEDIGRFNQQHRPEHSMSEVEQEDTLLHQLQRSNPDLTLPQLMEMIGMEIAPSSASTDP